MLALHRIYLAIFMVLFSLPYFTGLAAAQEVPRSKAQINLSFAPVVKKSAPAVVNIFTRRIVRQRQVSRLFDDPFFRQFLKRGPRRRQQNSLGSGVIVSGDGFIVTNHHVVKGADEIRVVLSDTRVFDAKIVLQDDKTDLAILKIKADRAG